MSTILGNESLVELCNVTTVSAEVNHMSCLYEAGDLYLPVVGVYLSMLHIS
jgi:hypothetical protein